MKKSQLRQIIKEEISKVLGEDSRTVSTILSLLNDYEVPKSIRIDPRLLAVFLEDEDIISTPEDIQKVISMSVGKKHNI